MWAVKKGAGQGKGEILEIDEKARQAEDFLRRPKLLIFNLMLTVILLAILSSGIIGKNLSLMVSPLVPATYLAIGLTNTELKDHMKFSIPIYWAISICMLIIAVIIGVVPLM